MTTKKYGGNIVKYLNSNNGQQNFTSDGPYEYFIFKSLANNKIIIDNLKSFTVYVLKLNKNSKLNINNFKEYEQGDCIQFENSIAEIFFEDDNIEILVAGTKKSHPEKIKKILHTKSEDIYKVVKPWGHELWINRQHPCYALKQIYIKKGTKTSLQYHHFKQETNVLFDGVGKLHYRLDDKEDFVNPKIGSVEIKSFCSVDVHPPTIHRLEAVSNLLLYEVSTPHLDDVIRIEDDAKRPDGRLESEHEK